MRKLVICHFLFVTIVVFAWLYYKHGNVPWFIYLLIIPLGFIYVRGLERTFLHTMKGFQNSRFEDDSAELAEPVLSKTSMNRFRGVFADGGTGYLLQDKLIFIPNKLYRSRERITIWFTDVKNSSDYRIYNIVDTGVKITLKSGKEERFVVDKSGEFFRLLMAKLA